MWLREATWEDRDFLFELANDEQVRANSFSQETIKYEDHINWLVNKLNDPTCKLFICMDENEKIGQIRLDISNRKAKISFSVVEAKRGQGIGTKMLELIKDKVEHELLVFGEVKKENQSSQRSFIKAGYLQAEDDGDYFIYEWVKNRKA
jgi:RimJ/RimL family protein N-acetyltransferase